MSKFNKKNNEEVPKDYFVKFGEKILNQTIEEELFEASEFPILNSIEKSQDFSIPEAYFSNFKNKKPLQRNNSFSLFRTLSIAASLLILVAIFTVSKNQAINSDNENLSSINKLELLTEDIESIEINELAELHGLIDPESSDELIFQELDHDKILNYLLEESDAYDLASIY